MNRARRALTAALLCVGCASAPPAAPSAAPPAPAASAGAHALIDASLMRRSVRTLPALTKMALVKLLPVEAPALAPRVDAALDNDRFVDEVARRVDEALSPEERAGAREALADPEVALVLSLLRDEAPPPGRPPDGGAARALKERLFEAASPPGRADALAKLPLRLAARVARASLVPSDARHADLARFERELPTLSRIDERDAFVRALAAARPEELDAATACFLEGPCAHVHDAIARAHRDAAEAAVATLERDLRAAP